MLFFVIGACFFLSAKNSCIAEQSKITAMTRHLNLLNERKKAAEEKNHTLSLAKKFIKKAESLNLTQKNWASDQINLNQPVTYLELEQLLNQCANTPDYYFKPSFLKIKIPEKARKSTSTLNLKLRGTFLTRLN